MKWEQPMSSLFVKPLPSSKTRVLLCACAFWILCARCENKIDNTSVQPSGIIQSPHDLPDPLWPKDASARKELTEHMLEIMYDSSLTVLTRGFGHPTNIGHTVAIGQHEYILDAIRRFRRGEFPPPIAQYGIYGVAGDGSPYISVIATSFARNINAIVAIYRDQDDRIIKVTYRRQVLHKDMEFDILCYFDARFISLSNFRQLNPDHEKGFHSLIIENGDPVPVPDDPNITACVRVEEYTGKTSQYIPLMRFDYIQDRLKESEPNND